MTILEIIIGEGVTILDIIIGTSTAIAFVVIVSCIIWDICNDMVDE